VLSIKKLPKEFSDGYFVFKYNDIEVKFHLRVVVSDADYNLIIPNTVINNTTSGGEIPVKVQKIDASGTITEIGKDNLDGIKLYKGDSE
jgi:hypothetical protein